MQRASAIAASALLAFLVNVVAVSSAAAQPTERPLRPAPPAGISVIPFMEGWYGNDDGSIVVSFGYHNRNSETVTIPAGKNNRIEPERLGGLQPEIYFPGRHHGVFAVTIPAAMADSTVWWHLSSANEDLKVPGERGSSAYELDRNPRPQGSVQPLIGFSEDAVVGSGPEGTIADRVLHASVGEAVTLEVWTEDPSKRDRTDPRFLKPLDTRVSWYKHQGPGEVTFTEHDSMPLIDTGGNSVLGLVPTPEHAVLVKEGVGPARVNVAFSEVGDYMIRVRLDNWRSSDSDGLDQCCWSNAYQRVQVTD